MTWLLKDQEISLAGGWPVATHVTVSITPFSTSTWYGAVTLIGDTANVTSSKYKSYYNTRNDSSGLNNGAVTSKKECVSSDFV